MSLTAQQIWTSLPTNIAKDMVGDMGAALRYGGFEPAAIAGIGRHMTDMIDQVRGDSTGPLTPHQKIELQVAVWEWCASTAKAGLPS